MITHIFSSFLPLLAETSLKNNIKEEGDKKIQVFKQLYEKQGF